MMRMTQRDVVVLGSTGSIGTQALDVCRANPDRFRVVALTAGGGNRELFRQQVEEWSPAFSGLGEDASVEAAALECDVVLNGITGAVGLRPTLSALDAGNTLALANKESLIIGGPVVTSRAKPGQIVPVDSEHSALAQCLRGGTAEEVRRLVLTASGGPFRGRTAAELAGVTVRGGPGPPDLGHGPGRHHQLGDPGEQGPRGDRGAPALRHPVRPDRGRGAPDERGALDGRVRRRLDPGAGQPADHADPHRARAGLARPGTRHRTARGLDPGRDVGVLPPRRRGVPVGVARPAGGEAGGTAPAVYNAANEVAVEAFRAGRLEFRRIVPTIADVLALHDVPSGEQLTVDDVLAADAWARSEATRLVGT